MWSEIVDDPLRMYLVIPRAAVTSLDRGCELADAAAVACVRRFAHDERFAADLAAWRQRPGKVTLRARRGQWSQLLAGEAHVLAGNSNGEAIAGLPPRRRSALGARRAARSHAGHDLSARATDRTVCRPTSGA